MYKSIDFSYIMLVTETPSMYVLWWHIYAIGCLGDELVVKSTRLFNKQVQTTPSY